MTEQTDIRLAHRFQAFVEDQVASGRFESASAVIEEALRLFEEYETREAALARALQEGLDSGEAEGFDIDDWLDERRCPAGEAA